MQPVLYLDIDDTLLSWASGHPEPVAATEGFLRWAMARFEVRWLSRWCPSGELTDALLGDLSKMVGVDKAALRSVRGCCWEGSGIKADGIAWVEHEVLGREFAWVENPDGLSARDLEVLRLAGCSDFYLPCDVTRDQTALDQVRKLLEQRFGGG